MSESYDPDEEPQVAPQRPPGPPHDAPSAGPEGPTRPYSAAGPQDPGGSEGPAGPAGPPGPWQAPAGYWSPPARGPQRSPRPKRQYSARALAGATATVFVMAGLAGFGVSRTVWDGGNSSSSAAGTTVPVPGSIVSPYAGSSSANDSTDTGAPADTSTIAGKVAPGLVDIETVLGYQDAEAFGTGIVLTSSGVILTNNHVISGATLIEVTDVGNGKTYSAAVVGYDRSDDIAVIKLVDASGLQTANPGSSSNLAVGQAIVGVGNAAGAGGTPSYAGGSITALDQSITATDEGAGTSEQLTGLIETNVNIEPGDSGGPLVNASGKVVGVDTAASSGYSFSEGGGTEGFAIPIDTALSIAAQIRDGKSSATVHIGATPFLGVGLSTSSPADGTSTVGTTVGTVISGTPAAKAGLVAGDTITAIGGVSVTTGNELTNAIDQHHPGDKVSVTWADSSGASHTANVTLAVGPAD